MPERAALQTAIDEFKAQAEGLRAAVAEESRARVVRNRIVNRIFRSLVAVLIIMALAGGFGWNYVVTNNHQREEQIARLKAETAAREHDRCVTTSETRVKLRENLTGLVKFAITLERAPTAAQRARGAVILKAYRAKVARDLPPVHC